MSMRGFVLDASTTGKDLFDRLSEEENGCIKEALGETVYNFMLNAQLLAGGGDPAAAAPLFKCLAPENGAILGVAFLSATVGGHTDESLACMTDLALAHPGLIYARFGLEWTGEADSGVATDATMRRRAPGPRDVHMGSGIRSCWLCRSGPGPVSVGGDSSGRPL